ncbi:unnamed protein product [Lactuca virosa]|uniref:Uncharacterized protein n=1 Tax=Lactuca virosa TaxID=75947 RepID=A0AAU9MU94_9ASTR|nr:unnamed protein product [Lactuca virosa]
MVELMKDLRADTNEGGGGYCDLPRWKEGRRSKQWVTTGGGRSGLRMTVAAGGACFGDSHCFCSFLPARSTGEPRWEEGVRVGDVWGCCTRQNKHGGGGFLPWQRGVAEGAAPVAGNGGSWLNPPPPILQLHRNIKDGGQQADFWFRSFFGCAIHHSPHHLPYPISPSVSNRPHFLCTFYSVATTQRDAHKDWLTKDPQSLEGNNKSMFIPNKPFTFISFLAPPPSSFSPFSEIVHQ